MEIKLKGKLTSKWIFKKKLYFLINKLYKILYLNKYKKLKKS